MSRKAWSCVRSFGWLWLGVIAFWFAASPAASSDGRDVRSLSGAPIRALEAAIILSDQEGGSLEIAAWRGLIPLPEQRYRCMLVIEADGSALTAKVDGERLQLDLYLYAVARDRSVVASTTQRIDLDLSRYGETIAASGVRMLAAVDLPPGDYLLRLLVRSTDELFGVRSFPVSIHLEAPETLSPSQPIFPDRAHDWVQVVPGSTQDSSLAAAKVFASTSGYEMPAALPVWPRDSVLRGQLLVQASQPVADSLSARLRPNSGASVVEVPVRFEGRVPAPVEGFDFVRFSLEPAEISADLYTVVLLSSPGEGTAIESASFRLMRIDSQSSQPWPRLRIERQRMGLEPPIAADLPTPPSGRSGVSADDSEVHRQYLNVLGVLAQGDTARAAASLALLERLATTEPAAMDYQRLAEIERSAWNELALDLEALQPLMTLHRRTIPLYRQRHESALTGHAIRTVTELAGASRARTASSEIRQQAAGMLNELADSEAVLGHLMVAGDLYGAALELVPDLPDARFGLASIYERRGLYEPAADEFERGLASSPERSEARLRYAVNLARTGRRKRARTELERLIATARESWTTVVAMQEVARLDAERDRPVEAIEILEDARDRWPDDFGVMVLLAYLLDRQGRRIEADAIVEALSERASATTLPSARWLYQEPVPAASEEAWIDQPEPDAVGLNELRSALATQTSGSVMP